jgi:hypothetical protein
MVAVGETPRQEKTSHGKDGKTDCRGYKKGGKDDTLFGCSGRTALRGAV